MLLKNEREREKKEQKIEETCENLLLSFYLKYAWEYTQSIIFSSIKTEWNVIISIRMKIMPEIIRR